MANKSAPLPTFEPDRFYAVNLARSTTWKGKPLSPAHNPIQLRGDVAEALRADIRAAALKD